METKIKSLNDFLQISSIDETVNFILSEFNNLTGADNVFILSILSDNHKIIFKNKVVEYGNNINILEFESLFSKKNVIVTKKNHLIDSYNLNTPQNIAYLPFIINKVLKKIVIIETPRCSISFLHLLSTILESVLERITLRESFQKKDMYFNEIFQKINSLIIIRDKNFNILFSNKTESETYKCFDLAFGTDSPCSFCPSKQREITKSINNRFYKINQEDIEDKKLCIIEEITNIINLKNELNKAEKLSFLGRVSSEITHEIKNPLNAMQLKITLLENILHRDNLLTPKTENIIKGVKGEILRLANIASDFLQFGKNYKLDKSYFSLIELLGETINDIKEKTSNANIDIFFFYNKKQDFSIYADKYKLKQAFLNLLNNAMDELISKKIESPKIEISIKEHDNNFEIDFIDNGLGITDSKELFTPFFTTKPHGTGLGLSITQKTILLHKGKIEYFREKERTIFRVILPINDTSRKEEKTLE